MTLQLDYAFLIFLFDRRVAIVYNVAVNTNTYKKPKLSTTNPPIEADTDQNIPHANVSSEFHFPRSLEGTISITIDREIGPLAFIRALRDI
jgi:hypothetical protein